MQIQCHGDSLTRIHEVVNPEILPSEFGGKLGPMSNEELFESALKHEKMFQGASTDKDQQKWDSYLDVRFNHISFTDLTTYGYTGRAVPEDLTQGPHPFQGYCMAEEQS